MWQMCFIRQNLVMKHSKIVTLQGGGMLHVVIDQWNELLPRRRPIWYKRSRPIKQTFFLEGIVAYTFAWRLFSCQPHLVHILVVILSNTHRGRLLMRYCQLFVKTLVLQSSRRYLANWQNYALEMHWFLKTLVHLGLVDCEQGSILFCTLRYIKSLIK